MPAEIGSSVEARPDDEAEDERDEEVILDACFFPHGTASPGASPLRRHTERDMREDSCAKGTLSSRWSDAIHVPSAIVLFKAARLQEVRISSRVLCDSCGPSVPATQGVLLSDCGQSRSCENSSFAPDAS